MYIYVRLLTLLHITTVEYIFSTQGSLNKLRQGVWEEKIFKTFIKAVYYTHIKIILIILIQACYHTLIQEFHHTLIQSCHNTLFFASTLHFLSYFGTLWICKPSTDTILRLFTLSRTQYYSLLHVTKPTSS